MQDALLDVDHVRYDLDNIQITARTLINLSPSWTWQRHDNANQRTQLQQFGLGLGLEWKL